MKKVTRYCCPVCGKDNWDRHSCPSHGSLWDYYAIQSTPERKLQVWNDIQEHGTGPHAPSLGTMQVAKVDQENNEVTMEWVE